MKKYWFSVPNFHGKYWLYSFEIMYRIPIGAMEHFILTSWLDEFTFEKLYLLKKGPIFVFPYPNQNKTFEKNICWHLLFRQKWTFSNLSKSVLHKCGHTNMHAKYMGGFCKGPFFVFSMFYTHFTLSRMY